MKKIHNISKELISRFPFAYVSTSVYLDFCAYSFIRNGDVVVVMQDQLFLNDFPSLFLPKNPLNWERCSVVFATKSDVESVRDKGIEIFVERPIGTEFFYRTDDFVNPSGSFGKKVRLFKRRYDFKIYHSYDQDKIKSFYDHWKQQRQNRSFLFEESEDFYQFCLNHLDDYEIKQVYVEVEGNLVGFAWGVYHPSGNWVGLHLKVDYSFLGLSRFLHHERAKLFEGSQEFTLGTGAAEEGIESYKRELHPSREQEYLYLLTGENKGGDIEASE